jgi:protein-L-isoaspartate(D-aspartate) O-methyltransferase
MNSFDAARIRMIESQLRPNKVVDDRVLRAFATIRRELFVPEHLQPVAYIDEDLPLGGGRYLMEPMVAARLLQAADVKATDIALVVSAGTGYEPALVAVLTRNVLALEEDPDLARRARAALVEHAIAAVNVVEGPLREGYRARAPYDVILFGGAVAEVPAEIAAQLAEGGRLLAVIRPANAVGRATLTTRTGGVLARRVIFGAATPVLPGFLPKPTFVFC